MTEEVAEPVACVPDPLNVAALAVDATNKRHAAPARPAIVLLMMDCSLMVTGPLTPGSRRGSAIRRTKPNATALFRQTVCWLRNFNGNRGSSISMSLRQRCEQECEARPHRQRARQDAA